MTCAELAKYEMWLSLSSLDDENNEKSREVDIKTE